MSAKGHPVTAVIEVIGGTNHRAITDSQHTLSQLAVKVARLSPSHRDPERFHVEKSEVVAELRRLARERRA